MSAIFPDFLIEIIARFTGYVVRFIRPGHETRAEGLVRGKIMGIGLKSQKLFVGRGVILEGRNRITIGDGVRLNHNVDVSVGKNGIFAIGHHSHIGRQSVIAAAGNVQIGNGCAISSHVSIFSVTNNANGLNPVETLPASFAPVVVEDGVFIGAGAVILPGVTIGKNATLGAGGVATKDIPSGEVWGGVPAKKISSKSAPSAM